MKSELLISLFLIILLTLLVNPFEIWMPSALVMMLVAMAAILVVVFAGFVWREKSLDEREGLHKLLANRFAYLAGMVVLLLGLISQSLNHNIDPWVAIALGVMVLAKAVGFLYARKRH